MSRADQIKGAKPKRQHWVPCFYLRYFATQETRMSRQPKVWVLSKHEGDPMLTSIRNVAHQRYLYSPRDEAGKRLWDLEGKFAERAIYLTQVATTYCGHAPPPAHFTMDL